MAGRTCRFRLPDTREAYKDAGYCRRMPPQLISYLTINGDQQIEQHFPWMSADEWCGEYQKPRYPQ